MTQTGKCDTCRQRKVKCDEKRPKCSSCKKKDRPCTYSYGKASAFVVQDPNQLTKHGRSRTTPVTYPLTPSDEDIDSSSTTPPNLCVTTERHAEDGQGYFQTLALRSKVKSRLSEKRKNRQQRVLQAYLCKLREEHTLVVHQPSSDETTLIARYVSMLGPDPMGKQPFGILGTWIQSIPSRIGSNKMLDLAVEFLVDSYGTFRDDMHSRRKVAKATKAKALKELQLIVMSTDNQTTYDVLLATKLHYAAEALLGLDTMYHAIHAFGLAELLRSGSVSGVDDEHFWDLIDNTYIDDVHEAMLAGRNLCGTHTTITGDR
ncbi:hypothetical protein ACET3X_002490 [Alternaria dauci]|uniref:Zn(2)-C6 fungal-type domain-containing protein n=1 Tax=Alternaria dauci TaxID=48095 RepID=A0ABR3UPP5_9PLEO